MFQHRPRRWQHVLGIGKSRPDESAKLEIEHHIAELTDRLVEEGSPPDDARREAERRFGDPGRYLARLRRMERSRHALERLAAFLEIVRHSLRSVVRTARREPGFAAAVVLTFALGIGANATMYGIIDRLLLTGPEHVVDPSSVVRVFVERPDRSGAATLTSFVAYPDYTALRAHSGIAGIAAYFFYGSLPVGSRESGGTASVASAAAELFPLLGVQPLLGRFFTTEEAQPGSALTVVIGYEYWRSAFSADPGVLGRAVEFNGIPYTIIGVAPPAFTGVDLRRVDVWLPFELVQTESGSTLDYSTGSQVVARLVTGASVPAAEAEATRIHLNSRQVMIDAGQYSDRARIVFGPLVAARGPAVPLVSSVRSADLRVVRWLTGVSLVVLLIACINVANLAMVRATRQRRAIDVRLALGAGRGTIAGQAMLESLALAAVGGAAALAIARWGGDVIRAVLFPDVLFPASALTPRTIAFTAVVVIVAGVGAALLPGLQTARHQRTIGPGRDGYGASSRRSTLRGALTAAQAGMTVVLLVGAGLFVRSLSELRALELGLDAERLVMAFPQLAPDVDPLRRSELILAGAEHVATLPFVEAAAATSSTFGGGGPTSQVRPEGVDSVAPLPGGGPYLYAGTPSLFETMGLSILRGRGIAPSDVPGSEPVAVVNETMARAFWPGADPLDECLFRRDEDVCAYRVVGVVEDAARNGFFDAPSAGYYLPLAQTLAQGSVAPNGIYVRARGDAADIVDDVTVALQTFSPEVRMALVETVRGRLDPQARSWTLGATLFTVFGLLGLVVGAIGLYGVLAYDVTQRTREIGIRSALGARKHRLLGSVVTRGARMGAIGVGIGLAVSYLAAPYIQDLLFETSPRDPVVFTTVALVLLTVSVTASWVPALRATRVDPVTALKAD